MPTNTGLKVTTRLIDVLEDEVDEKYYLSDEKTKKLTLELNNSGNKTFSYNRKEGLKSEIDIAHTINQSDYRGLNRNQDQNCVVIPVLTPDRINKRQNGRRFKNNGEPMFTLTSQDRHGIAIREATKKGYAIAERGDSVNYTYPNSTTRRGRVGKQVAQTLQAGEVNQGVVINPLKNKTDYGWHFEQAVYDSQGITRTVKANGGSGNIPKTIEGLRIRKLTPLECWRLQGFTDEQFYKAKDSGVSNSQLYKQAGNSVTVNVVEAIVGKL